MLFVCTHARSISTAHTLTLRSRVRVPARCALCASPCLWCSRGETSLQQILRQGGQPFTRAKPTKEWRRRAQTRRRDREWRARLRGKLFAVSTNPARNSLARACMLSCACVAHSHTCVCLRVRAATCVCHAHGTELVGDRCRAEHCQSVVLETGAEECHDRF